VCYLSFERMDFEEDRAITLNSGFSGMYIICASAGAECSGIYPHYSLNDSEDREDHQECLPLEFIYFKSNVDCPLAVMWRELRMLKVFCSL